MTLRATSAALVIIAHLVCAYSARSQVIIPPPDDLVEALPVLPPGAGPSPSSPEPPSPATPTSLPFSSVTTPQQARDEARQLGSALRQTYQGIPTASGAAAQVPGYSASYPQATQYYDHADALASDGAVAAGPSEAWRTANSPSRPRVDVRREDLARATAIAKDPDRYVDGTTAGGSGGACTPLPPGTTEPSSVEMTCNLGTSIVDHDESCRTALEVKPWEALSYQYLCVSSPSYEGCSALVGAAQCRSTGTTPVPEYNLTVTSFTCDAPVSDPDAFLIGTATAPPPTGAFEASGHIYRCNRSGLSQALALDPSSGAPRQYLTDLQQCTEQLAAPSCVRTEAGPAGLEQRQLCLSWDFDGDPAARGKLHCLETAPAEEVYACSTLVPDLLPERSDRRWFTASWTDSACAADPANCTSTGETCSAPDQTRVIAGIPIHRACWEKTRTWQCQEAVGGNSDCASIEATPGCRQTSESCLDDPPAADGSCQVRERSYSCSIPGSDPAPQQYLCSGDVYCLNGECETVEREASDEFKDALVGLHALGQANAEFSETDLSLFKGTRETCAKKIFGISNCCTGKGAPILTPWLCSAAEQQLDKKDDAGLCHKVGTYCSSKVLGVCVTKRDAYCCFASKLTRMLQEQGRVQLHRPWAAPKTESCAGFSVFEFQQLDLSAMNFAEIYADFSEAARLPEEAAMLVEVQKTISEFYAQAPQ